jgi:hypothetical protein
MLPAAARNVDLSTVPDRATVQLTIYNTEDLTLVRETRAVSFKKGVNPLQFSWANTLIDPTSVELRFPGQDAKLEVIDTTFPHDKPQMLYWNVQSEWEGEATIEISYFTSGIAWTADYTAIAGKDEAKLSLDSFVRVTNNSGEDYENAQVRLVVGTINLVEKIAELAQISHDDAPMKMERDEAPSRELRQRAAKSVMRPAAPPASAMAGAMMDMAVAEAVPEPKEIAKESLSEYFIYTIEGTETIPNGWAKRLRSFSAADVPMKVQYRYREREYGDNLVRLYLLTNDKPSNLGLTPLPNGAIRVFRDNGRGGLSYLAAQELKYIPIGDKIELNLGVDPEVIFELVKLKVFRDELWMRLSGGDAYRKIGGGVNIELNSQVAGWNDHTVYTQRIRNYTQRPIEVEIRRVYSGDVVFKSQLQPKLHDYQTVQYTKTVAPAEKADFYHEVMRRNGHNAKKNNVELLEGEAGR